MHIIVQMEYMELFLIQLNFNPDYFLAKIDISQPI